MRTKSKHMDGFVGYLSSDENLRILVQAASAQKTVNWTVNEKAGQGDLIVFYFAKPVSSFIAYGRVVRRVAETWGDEAKRMAKIGEIRLLPSPVSLARAKKETGLSWLNAAQGFGKRAQERVDLLLILGGAPAAKR